MSSHTFGILDTKDITIDASQAFLLWTANNFDCAATAHVLGISAIALQRVIDDEQWVERVAPIVAKIKSQKAGDFDRACNRAIAFVQGTRFRLICERVISEITGWDRETLRENLSPENISKSGSSRKISTRFLGDLASAIEKANAICFAALSDTATERAKRNDSAEVPVIDMHAAIAKCMGSVGDSKTPRKMLLESQLEQAESIKTQAAIPKPRPDDSFVDESGG